MISKFPMKVLRSITRRVFGRTCKSPSQSSLASSKGRSPPLPIELFELIIDFVRPDRQTLLACALTCRAWLPRSRYNLFYNIQLRSIQQLAHFSGMLTSEPHIGSLVRQMLIVPHHGQGQVYGAFPFVLGEKLPQIEHLSLDLRRDYYPYVHPDFFQLLSGFSTVTSLDVHRIQFPSLNDFGLLICAFPRLTNLSCWMVSWTKKTYDAGTFKALDRRLSLRSLSLRDVRGMGEMVEWLLTVTSSLQLDTISLPTVSVRDVGPVGRLLDVVGASLRHLEIGIILRASPQLQTKAVTEWEGSVGTYPRLIRNTSLTSLQIDLQGTDSDKWASWASGLLLQTAPSCVSRITILIQIPSRPTKLKQSHCGSIDGVLSLPQFCNLRQVVFQYEDGTDAERLEWFRGALPTLFPLTCARNLVRLKQVASQRREA